MKLNKQLPRKIKKTLERFAPDSISTRMLMEQVGMSRSDRKTFLSLLNDLEAGGEIHQVRRGRWSVPEREDLIEGVLKIHPDGFGFLRPDDGLEDLFIPPGDLGTSMHGDRVSGRVVRIKRDGRRSGKVVEVLERARQYVVGTYEKGYLYPANDRIQERIFVPKKARRQIVDGEVAEVKITKYPEPGVEPMGEVICRLGSFDDPSVDLTLIISEHNLPREFPDEVIRAAENGPKKVTAKDRQDRVDLRKLPLITVDPESARDFDDAVHVRREKSGWRLWVAIADVSHYVTPGSALDQEAIARGTSIYFPEGVIPMLPEEISAGIASLKPDLERLAMVAEITFKYDGTPATEKFYPAVIKSAKRLSYDQVSRAMLEYDPDERKRIKDRLEDLDVMLEVAAVLHKARHRRGGLDFDMPEAQVMLDKDGDVEGIFKSEQDRSHNMVEEFMLAANEAVARYMAKHRLPSLFRVHEDPDSEKLMKLSEMLGGFGLAEKFPKNSRDISRRMQKIIRKAKGKPFEALVNMSLLRSMKLAKYDPENLGHFGLAADHYLHFTSPIRRYPDLFVHRMLKAHLAGEKIKKAPRIKTKELAQWCSGLERRAEEAERDMDKLKAARFMKTRIGEEFDGFISSVATFGIFVEIKDYFVEGLIHETRLPHDQYTYDERSHQLKGRRTGRTFSIGDPVRVVVSGASIEKRQVDFDLVEGA